jgi:hypothetical protein
MDGLFENVKQSQLPFKYTWQFWTKLHSKEAKKLQSIVVK